MSEKFDYDKCYTNYWNENEIKAHESDYYNKNYGWIKKHLKVEGKNIKVIDIGGGNGSFSAFMGYKDATILDISDSGLKYAREKFGYKTIKTDIHKRFSVKEEMYDVAYCFEVLEHLEFPTKVLSETNTILKRGGILFISIPNFKPDGVFHKRRWKQKELEEDLKKSGYEVVWFKNIPRFNMPISEIRKTKNRMIVKIVLAVFHIVFFKELRFILCRLFPNFFTATQIGKCRKVA